MTFVMDHRDYQHYFTTTRADFQAAVQPFTKGAGMFYEHPQAFRSPRYIPPFPAILYSLVSVVRQEVSLMTVIRELWANSLV